jgi:hypothetical protein
MKPSTGLRSGKLVTRVGRSSCRRMIAAIVLTACVFVAPVIASVSHGPLHEVRLPRIDSRVVENLQRWADEEKDSWTEEI